MKRIFGGHSRNASTQSLSALDEPQALQEAMAATAHILNDDVDRAESELAKGNSPFHKLGRGMVGFLRATIGFEQDVMREASERLAEAEVAATEHQRRAHKDAYKSAIYPVGSEYALCYAESLLMTAVVAVLNESLTESLKGFYKIRKAHATLQEIADAEKRYVKRMSETSLNGKLADSQSSLGLPSSRPSTSRNLQTAPSGSASASSSRPGSSRLSTLQQASGASVDDDDDFEFVDADETHGDQVVTDSYTGHVEANGLSNGLSSLTVNDQGSLQAGTRTAANSTDRLSTTAAAEPEVDFGEFITHPVDIFIHSGTSLCFGVLQLMLSLVPPALTKLLSIVGFRGDRDAGVAMLWRATKYDNINGSFAGLITLGYYNGMVNFCDIVASDSNPKARCRALLTTMRERYPGSRLWLLEESRMLAGDKHLEEALEITRQPNQSSLKQIEALGCFEHSLNSMYLHNYEECALTFMKCVDLNNWSHGLYYYIAGCCYVELYRLNKDDEPGRAQKYAARATELLDGVTSRSSKKRFLARQLPFDVFVTRKIAKWQARATEFGIPFIDAIGVSPIEEMIYFWNGYKKMRSENLEISMQRLEQYSNPRINPRWESEGLDEKSLLYVLQAAIMTRLGLYPEARQILKDEVLCHDWALFKGPLKDNWTLPVANYEMAVCAWEEAGGERGVGTRDDLIKECAEWTDKVSKWEAYDLDARVGMKVRSAQDTLKKYGYGM